MGYTIWLSTTLERIKFGPKWKSKSWLTGTSKKIALKRLKPRPLRFKRSKLSELSNYAPVQRELTGNVNLKFKEHNKVKCSFISNADYYPHYADNLLSLQFNSFYVPARRKELITFKLISEVRNYGFFYDLKKLLNFWSLNSILFNQFRIEKRHFSTLTKYVKTFTGTLGISELWYS